MMSKRWGQVCGRKILSCHKTTWCRSGDRLGKAIRPSERRWNGGHSTGVWNFRPSLSCFRRFETCKLNRVMSVIWQKSIRIKVYTTKKCRQINVKVESNGFRRNSGPTLWKNEKFTAAATQCDDFANFPPNFKFSVKLFLKISPIYPKWMGIFRHKRLFFRDVC